MKYLFTASALLLALNISAQTYKSKDAVYLDQLSVTDAFNDNSNGWNLRSYVFQKDTIANGEFIQWSNDNSVVNTALKNVTIDGSKDFEISATAVHLEGGTKNFYGLAFGKKTGSGIYYFMINADGYFTLRGDHKTIIKDTMSSAILTGSAPNILSVRKKNGMYYLYINDKLIVAAKATADNNQDIGFVTMGAQKTAFDDFLFYGNLLKK